MHLGPEPGSVAYGKVVAEEIIRRHELDHGSYWLARSYLNLIETLEFYSKTENYDIESGAVKGTAMHWGKEWPSLDFGQKARDALGVD